jgi:hypothetical protein
MTRFAAVALMICVGAALYAQDTNGLVTGLLTDTASRPVSGVTVTLTNEATGQRRETNADVEGWFSIGQLPPGAYRLEARRDGYCTHVLRFVLQLGQQVVADIPLAPGRVMETINVTNTRELLKPDSAAIGAIIGNWQITELPLDGRNFYELSLLVPGVAPAAQESAGTVRGEFAMHVSGAREDSNTFLLDGVYNGDPKLNGIALNPPVDAIREFEVVTGTYNAEYGSNAGGQISVALKSGSNQFHGSAYGFLRNGVFDARSYFAPAAEPAPPYTRGQFGASLGGPLARDRTFFFTDYEGLRSREGITSLTRVPTALERKGDYSQSSLPAIDPTTGAPFAGKVIPAAWINPIGAAIANLYPLPNREGATENYVSSPTSTVRNDHFDLRLDHSPRQASNLTMRYSFADAFTMLPFSGPDFAKVPGYGVNTPRRAQNAALSETHVFTPTLISQVRFGFSRTAMGVYQQNMGRNVNAAVGLPTVSAYKRDEGLSLISVTGYSALGDEYNNPQHSATSIYEGAGSLTWARNRHVFKAGAGVRFVRQNAYRDIQARGLLSFLGMSGNALAELLMGLPTVTGVARADNPQRLRTHGESLFVQDTFRIRPDLTLSFGLRYEYNAPPEDGGGRASVFDTRTGAVVPLGTDGVPRGGYLPDRNSWAPRFGFAWNPRGGHTVVRGGYGVYYAQAPFATGEGIYFNPPNYTFQLAVAAPTAPLSLYHPFADPGSTTTTPSALAIQQDLRSGYSQQWSFGIQHSLGPQRVLEATYVGSKGTKLLAARDFNQPEPSSTLPNPRPRPGFADINILESRGNSSYQSLQVSFRQNLMRGSTLLAAYTFSKSIDDASGFFSSAGDPNYPQNSLDTRAERGLSSFDLRHRFSLAYSCIVPGRGRLLGGWQMLGIWTIQSGRPFTVALLPSFDNSNTGQSSLGFGANDRPDVLGNPALSNPSVERWFDTGKFVIPPTGHFGNSGRNILTGPGLQNWNASLIKNVSLRESLSLQFRTEVFNAFNHPNFGLPGHFAGSADFGRVTSSGSPRHIQFGVKLLF